MKVVVTGSTRGIGHGLATHLLRRGASVVVSGRTQATVERVLQEFAVDHPGRVAGQACDVRDWRQVEALWDAAVGAFGAVDVWVNNAGLSAPRVPLWDLPPDRIDAAVDTNLRGTLHGCRVAMRGMLAQGSGTIYNLDGFGSGDQVADGMSVYGATKRAIRYLRAGLATDLEDTSVRIGSISPGVVATDLLEGDYQGQPERWAQVRRTFNMIGETVDTVGSFLAEGILAGDQDLRWEPRRHTEPRDLFDGR